MAKNEISRGCLLQLLIRLCEIVDDGEGVGLSQGGICGGLNE